MRTACIWLGWTYSIPPPWKPTIATAPTCRPGSWTRITTAPVSTCARRFLLRTSAWERLRNSFRGDFKASVRQHLSGSSSAPFSAGTHEQIAVKVIDDRGNELLVVKHLAEADT